MSKSQAVTSVWPSLTQTLIQDCAKSPMDVRPMAAQCSVPTPQMISCHSNQCRVSPPHTLRVTSSFLGGQRLKMSP